jgi:putative DNA primase/helicase
MNQGDWDRQIELAAAKNKAEQGTAADHPGRDDEAFIAALAGLSEFEYQLQRCGAARALGLRVTMLDKLVFAKRSPQPEPPLFAWWEVEPSAEPVDAEVLLTRIVGRIRSHVVIPDDAARIATLWTVMTWVHEQAAIHSPILLVTLPEPNSGKTTLLGVLSFLVRRSLRTAGVSAAALYRAVEKWEPTIMVDEADTAFIDNDDLRRVVNSGWTRGEGVLLCDGDNNEPRVFPTFCPKALGMKGRKLPDTTMSRTIVIEMARKRPSERAIDFQYVDDAGLAELRSDLARFAADNADRLQKARPILPEGFENRRAANWQLLLAIADTAGKEWAWKARAAAEKIAGAPMSESVGVDLLADIKKAFKSKSDPDCFPSRQLIESLTADPESRWCEWGRDRKHITQKQLAGLLREYQIISTTVHPIDQSAAKGYRRLDFEEAWARYLPPETHAGGPYPPFEAFKRTSADEMGTTSHFRNVREARSEGIENVNLSNNHAGLYACTDRKAESGPARVSAPPNTTASGPMGGAGYPPPPSSRAATVRSMRARRRPATGMAGQPSLRLAARPLPSVLGSGPLGHGTRPVAVPATGRDPSFTGCDRCRLACGGLPHQSTGRNSS